MSQVYRVNQDICFHGAYILLGVEAPDEFVSQMVISAVEEKLNVVMMISNEKFTGAMGQVGKSFHLRDIWTEMQMNCKGGMYYNVGRVPLAGSSKSMKKNYPWDSHMVETKGPV